MIGFTAAILDMDYISRDCVLYICLLLALLDLVGKSSLLNGELVEMLLAFNYIYSTNQGRKRFIDY